MNNCLKKSLIFTVGLVLSTILHAGNYTQTVKLHAGRADNSRPICFLTSDLFDYGLCRDGTQKTYKHGPKNWALYIAPYNEKYVFDSSCLRIFSLSNFPTLDFKMRTPDQNGTLDVYASTKSYSKNNKKYIEMYNCSANWTSVN